jgi:hypothetical protein
VGIPKLIDPNNVLNAVYADIAKEDKDLLGWIKNNEQRAARFRGGILGDFPQRPPPTGIKPSVTPNEESPYYSTEFYLFDPLFFSFKPSKDDARKGNATKELAGKVAGNWDIRWDMPLAERTIHIPARQAPLIEEAFARGYTVILTSIAIGVYRDPILFNRAPIALIGAQKDDKKTTAKVTYGGVEYPPGLSPSELRAKEEAAKISRKEKKAELEGLLDEDQMRADAHAVGLTDKGLAALLEQAQLIGPDTTKFSGLKERITPISVAGALAFLARWATALAFQRSEKGEATRLLINRLGGLYLGPESEREEEVRKEKAKRPSYAPLLMDDASPMTVSLNHAGEPKEAVDKAMLAAEQERTRRWRAWRKETGLE